MSLNLSSGFSGFNLEMSKLTGKEIYEFEKYRLDAEQLMLSRNGHDISLPRKAVETLLVLVGHRGRIVSKDELLEKVWKDVIVEESNLYGYLHTLRNTLGYQENGKPFIETLRRRGYRFNGDVRVIGANADNRQTDLSADEDARKSFLSARKILFATVFTVGLAGIVLTGLLYSKTQRRTVDDRRLTTSEEAYRLYLEGYDLAQRLTPTNYSEAIKRFGDASKLDPDYPSPYVGIATAHRVNMLSADARPMDRVSIGNGKLSALKAVDLAPELAEAHIALGMITFFYDWDWKAAEEQLRTGYDLNPDIEDTNIQLAHFYSNMGRFDEALRHSEHARELKPLESRTQALHGMILFYAGRYDESIAHLKERIEFEPSYGFYHFNLQRSYLAKGMYRQALEEGELASANGFKSLELVVHRAYAYVGLGEFEKARDALAELNDIASRGYVGPCLLALIYNVLGDKEQALTFLEKAYDARDWRMTFLKVDPRWNNLRSEPRFIELIRKMNF
jgi:DNA-binding winged helix-turn-helix (wHTH) protein/Tfp pilus assembly protein PilF